MCIPYELHDRKTPLSLSGLYDTLQQNSNW